MVILDNHVVNIIIVNFNYYGFSNLLHNYIRDLAWITNGYCISECYTNEVGPDASTRMLTKFIF